MKNKVIILVSVALTLLVNFFLYSKYAQNIIFHNYVFCTTKTTLFGYIYMRTVMVFCNFVLMPTFFYWIGKGLKAEYLNTNGMFSPLFFSFVPTLMIFLPLMLGVVFEPSTCPASEFTLFGKIFFIIYIGFLTSIGFAFLVFVNRILFWEKKLTTRKNESLGNSGSNNS